ncbi:MAG: SMP-30/gluconolactonase/LRE family protein [Anaerolineae bacterium]|nr:SMP-30/gluconolactonase/LRE family protein [Anaerolineae bacterium]
MNEVEHVLAVQNDLGEGPLWDAEAGVLYWVDINPGRFYRWDPAAAQYETFAVGVPVGALALRTKGGMVLATKDGLAFWDTETQALDFIAHPEADRPSRFNDGKVDRQGRFWAGTMTDARSPTGALYRLDPDRALHTMVTGVTVSNGIGWSPDNRTMYYTDSTPRIIYAYDFDPATGAISNQRPFVHTPGSPDVPDGLTVDSEGFIWSARWDGWRVVRYDPDGKVEREIPVPAQRPTSVMFGGPNLDELYITTARTGLSTTELEGQPKAGDLFRVRPGVRGLPESKFAG